MSINLLSEQTGSKRNLGRIASFVFAAALLGASCGTQIEPGEDDTTGTGVDSAGIDSDEKSSGLVSQYPLDELPEGNKREELLALVHDVHGPTDNVSQEMNRLAYFPDVETLPGSNIVEVSVNPDLSGDRLYLVTEVGILLDTDAETLATFFETTLTKDGWELTESENGSSLGDSFDTTERTFERFSDSFELGETLEVVIEENTDVSKRVAKLTFSSFNFTDTSLFDRFKGWHGDIPLPDNAEHHESRIATIFANGNSKTIFSANYDVDEGDNSEDAMRTAIIAQAEAKGFEYQKTMGDQWIDLAVPSDIGASDWSLNYVPQNIDGRGNLSISGHLELKPSER